MRTNQDQSNYMFLDPCVSAAQSICRSVISRKTDKFCRMICKNTNKNGPTTQHNLRTEHAGYFMIYIWPVALIPQ